MLGIAFECWDRNKPSRGGALQSPLPANALCKRDYSSETFRDFGGKIGDKTLIMIPHQYTINDHRMQEEGTRHEFFEKFKDEFDYRYEIGGREPTMMNVITHGYLSSRVPYVDTFEKIIAYAKSRKDVWFARRGDIAAWARKYYTDDTLTSIFL